LVLHGIGGRTIREAKNNLAYDEYLEWVEYIRMRGSLNPGRRIEQSIAILAFYFNKAFFRGHVKYSDFTPHENEPEASVSDVIKLFKAVPNAKRKRHKPRDKS
jgi:hypothetical protein